jgi:flagellar export protein FliJ
MKKFRFPLERVTEWRRTQARIEESKLERLHAELRGLAERIQTVEYERDRAGKTLVEDGEATGLELALLDAFRKAADAEVARLENASSECRRRIDTQMNVVSEKRRDVRLLEKLKERKLRNWSVAYDREVEQQAEEAYLARWIA